LRQEWQFPAQCGVEENNVNKRTAVVVAVVAVLLVVPLAGSASAHEEHKVDRYTVEVGFGTEPAYAGIINSVQLIISNNGKPVTGARGLKVAVSTGDAEPRQMPLEPYFGADFGDPGDYRAFFIPTTPGAYTFKVTGTLGGKKVDQSYTSGKRKGRLRRGHRPVRGAVSGAAAVRLAAHQPAGPGDGPPQRLPGRPA
jgi:hypothetical protein